MRGNNRENCVLKEERDISLKNFTSFPRINDKLAKYPYRITKNKTSYSGGR